MGRKPKYSKKTKLEIIKRFKDGEGSAALANEYGLWGKGGVSSIYKWVNKYNQIGEKAFDYNKKNKSYSKELKKAAINEYLEGKGSLEDIVNKYEISNHELLRKWIIKYNSHIEIMDYDPKPEVYMAESRKTTYEERIAIVEYCLKHENNFKETALQYGVNYSQVYTWVKKYKQQGEDGLLDRRGRKKLESEMTEEEKLKYQLKKLEAKNAYLEMENRALKKLEEIERRMIRGKSKL